MLVRMQRTAFSLISNLRASYVVSNGGNLSKNFNFGFVLEYLAVLLTGMESVVHLCFVLKER